MRTLLHTSHWVFLGWSGADLDANESYLGLAAASENARGFTWLYRIGEKPRASVVRIREAYGDRAAIVHGELPDWLDLATAALLPSQPTAHDTIDPGKSRRQAQEQVTSHASRWAEEIGTTASALGLEGILVGQAALTLRQCIDECRRVVSGTVQLEQDAPVNPPRPPFKLGCQGVEVGSPGARAYRRANCAEGCLHGPVEIGGHDGSQMTSGCQTGEAQVDRVGAVAVQALEYPEVAGPQARGEQLGLVLRRKSIGLLPNRHSAGEICRALGPDERRGSIRQGYDHGFVYIPPGGKARRRDHGDPCAHKCNEAPFC